MSTPVPYTGQTIIPPRPETVIPPHLLPQLEAEGWVAQAKKNGTHSVIFVPPDRSTIFAKTRHGVDHKAWQFTPGSRRIFEKLPGGYWVFDAELMHSKGGGHRDTNYIHDVLVADNEWLVRTSFRDRRVILRDIFPQVFSMVADAKPLDTHYVLDDHTWLARNFFKGFSTLYNSFTKSEDEGLVLKKPDATMLDKNWLAKCRRATRNYGSLGGN